MSDIAEYLKRDPYFVPKDQVSVPEIHSLPDLTETLGVVEKARFKLLNSDLAKIEREKGEEFIMLSLSHSLSLCIYLSLSHNLSLSLAHLIKLSFL